MITTSEIYPYTEDTLQSNNLQNECSEHLGQTINELTIEKYGNDTNMAFCIHASKLLHHYLSVTEAHNKILSSDTLYNRPKNA